MAIANITGNILTDSGISTSSLLPLAGGIMTGQIVLKEGTNSTDYTKGLNIYKYLDMIIVANTASGGELFGPFVFITIARS